MEEQTTKEIESTAGAHHESISAPALENYNSSKKSAPSPLTLDILPASGDGFEHRSFDYRNAFVASPSSDRSNPISFDVPAVPSTLELSLSAFQYLPVPVLVLDSDKTVVLFNEAMSRMCGANSTDASEQGGRRRVYTTDSLKGQTLAQIGVDMLDKDGSPVWVNWEEFLDTIDINDQDDSNTSSNPDEQYAHTPTNQGPISKPTKRDISKTTVHDTCVDVIISPLRCMNFRSSVSGLDSQSNAKIQLVAQMIISAWTLEDSTYFTLTFTSPTTHLEPSATPQKTSRTVSKPTRFNSSPNSHSSGSSFSNRRSQTESTPSSTLSSPSSSVFLPPGPPSRANLSSTPSILQKTTRLREGLLNCMRLPCYAVWHDFSVGIPNMALTKLLPDKQDDDGSSQADFLSQFKVWKEDFSRLLEFEEWPIMTLCKSQKPFQNFRIGLTHPKTGKPMVYDTDGECVRDENGEFQGAIVILKDVTEYLDKLQAQKEKTAEQFEIIANMVPQMVWTTTPDGLHDWFSHRWYEYTGLTEEESIGEGWRLPFHPDDMPATVPRWKHSLQTGDEYVTEYRCRRKDGQWRWMLGRALPLRDAHGTIVRWFGTCTDIHEAVEARENERRNREQLLLILDTAHITLWSVDMKRNLVLLEGSQMWHNDKTHGTHKDLVGRNLYDLFTGFENPEYSRQYQEPIEMILEGQSQEEVREFRVQGSDRRYRTRYLPVYHQNKVADAEGNSRVLEGAVAISVDITELRAREKDLLKQEQENSRLVANAMAAKAASEMKSQFLYTVSHEVRSPIAGVIGMSELLLDTQLNQEQKECAENIQRSANGLLTVINDILDFSKVESGRLDIEEVQFNLSVVIKDVHKMLSFAAERKNLTYESSIANAIARDLRVIGDPGRLRQILQNLLTNSIKFTDEGSVLLSAKIKSETQDSLRVEFVVEDTGIGIEEEVQKNLFKPFSQADSSTARRYGGTGLGLSISKSLVELMQGKIKLQSRLGAGTVVTFWIPFKKAEYGSGSSPLVELNPVSERLQSDLSISCGSSDRATPPATPVTANSGADLAPSTGPGATALHKKVLKQSYDIPEAERKKTHILVVEDNPINQQFAIKTLEKLNFSVSACWNGQEAIDYLVQVHLNTQPTPDLILMDVQMPVVDGYQATEIIRAGEQFPELRQIPIVAMTASAIQGDKEKCQRAGMDDYLAKPVRRKVLETMIVKWATRAKERKRPVLQSDGMLSSPEFSATKNPTPAMRIASSQDPQVLQSNDVEKQKQWSNFERESAIAKSSATENASLMRRAEAEERAISLRDEKLMDMAHDPRSASHPSVGEELLSQPSLALTEENIDKLVGQQEDTKAARLGRNLGAFRSNLSLAVHGRQSMDSSRAGDEDVPPRGSVRLLQKDRAKQDSDNIVTDISKPP